MPAESADLIFYWTCIIKDIDEAFTCQVAIYIVTIIDEAFLSRVIVGLIAYR